MHIASPIAGIGPDVETGVGVLVCVGDGVALVTKKRVEFPDIAMRMRGHVRYARWVTAGPLENMRCNIHGS